MPTEMAAFLMKVDGWVDGGDPPRPMDFYKAIADALDKGFGATLPGDLEDDFMRDEIRNAAADLKDKHKLTAAQVALALKAQKAAGNILNHMGRAEPLASVCSSFSVRIYLGPQTRLTGAHMRPHAVHSKFPDKWPPPRAR